MEAPCVSLAAVRADLAILKNVATEDVAGFRAATRSIASNCRKSRAGLAKYCREGLLEVLAKSVAEVPSQPTLLNSTLDVTLIVAKLLAEGGPPPASAPAASGTAGGSSTEPAGARVPSVSFNVGDAVLARRQDGDLCEGTVAQKVGDSTYLVMWSDSHDTSAQLDVSDIMPLAHGLSLGDGRRRHRVAPGFILNNFLLKTAIPSSDLSRVQMVVRDGADVNCTDADGNSPLSVAISHDTPIRLVLFLLSRGAQVNAAGVAGTPLQLAAAHGNSELVECLLQHGADASVVDLRTCAEGIATQLRQHLSRAAGATGAGADGMPCLAPACGAATCGATLAAAPLSALYRRAAPAPASLSPPFLLVR